MVASYFIGIDVSKDTLDLALVTGNEVKTSVQIANTVTAAKKAVKDLIKQCGFKVGNAVFCMEHNESGLIHSDLQQPFAYCFTKFKSTHMAGESYADQIFLRSSKREK